MTRRKALIALYDLVTGDEDARVCKDIPESACADQPRNFFLQLASAVATKIGDELASTRLVLPWVLSAAGAPAWLLGLLVPIRESGSLVPQLVVAAVIRRSPLRKTYWIAGSVIQGLCVLGMAAASSLLEGLAAGLAVIGLLVLFSLARGLCSVAGKDVMGKTVSKTRRGTLTGYAGSVAGVATIGAGAWVDASGRDAAGTLLVAAGLLWFVAAAIYAGLAERPGATEGGGNAITEAVRSIGLLRTHTGLRRFVITRALLLSTALLMPFYAALAQEREAGVGPGLGLLLVSAGLASMLSSAVWGRLADRSSRDVMTRAAGLAGALSLVAGVVGVVRPGWLAHPLVLASCFLVMGVAHAGVRVGRKTYLVDMATAETRATFVAVSNTVIGILLLGGSVFGLVAWWLGTAWTIVILGTFALAGAAATRRLEEVTR